MPTYWDEFYREFMHRLQGAVPEIVMLEAFWHYCNKGRDKCIAILSNYAALGTLPVSGLSVTRFYGGDRRGVCVQVGGTTEEGAHGYVQIGARDLSALNNLWAEHCTSKNKDEQRADNSAMDAIAALADKWCDSTNQPDSICIALYQFTQWARQQHQ